MKRVGKVWGLRSKQRREAKSDDHVERVDGVKGDKVPSVRQKAPESRPPYRDDLEKKSES